MKLSELETIIKDVFDGDKVMSVDSVYEKDGDHLKLVITIQNLILSDSIIIHTRFCFPVDAGKTKTINDTFTYLYDINCIYKNVKYVDLKKEIDKILKKQLFGKDLKILSVFIQTPALLLNHYFKENGVDEYTVYNVEYSPKFKSVPCKELTFDFVININNNYDIKLSIKKTEKYEFIFSYLDEYKKVEVDTLNNINSTIGSQVVELLNNIYDMNEEVDYLTPYSSLKSFKDFNPEVEKEAENSFDVTPDNDISTLQKPIYDEEIGKMTDMTKDEIRDRMQQLKPSKKPLKFVKRVDELEKD